MAIAELERSKKQRETTHIVERTKDSALRRVFGSFHYVLADYVRETSYSKPLC